MPSKVGVGLKPVQSISHRLVPSKEVLESEYASRYLQQIGVSITKENVDTLLKELPIDKALVLPVWARGEMAIFPGLGNARKGDVDHIVKSMYKANGDGDGENKKKKRRGQGGRDGYGAKGGTSSSERKEAKGGEGGGGGGGGEGAAEGETTADDDTSINGAESGSSSQQSENNKRGNGNGKGKAGAAVGTAGANAANVKSNESPKSRAHARAPLDAQPHIPRTTTPSGRKISWATVHTLDFNKYGADLPGGVPTVRPSGKIQLPGGETIAFTDINTPEFQHLLQPPDFQTSDMDGSIYLFCASMGLYAPRIKDDKTGKSHDQVKAVLESRIAHQLFGLLTHYAYWNILHPWARDVLKAASMMPGFNFRQTGAGINMSRGESVGVRADANEDEDIEVASLTDAMEAKGLDLDQPMSLSGLESITSLQNVDKEKLFLQVEDCLITLLGKIGNSNTAIVTSQQCLVCCSHYVVDDLLTIIYPWLNAHMAKKARPGDEAAGGTDNGTVANDGAAGGQAMTTGPEDETDRTNGSPSSKNTSASTSNHTIKKKKKKQVYYSEEARLLSLKVRRLMHQSIADLLDPSRIYTKHMLVASYVGTDAKSLTKTGGKGRFYVTSVAVRCVFGDAQNDCTRRFMMNREDTYVPTPGISKKFDEKDAIAKDERKAKKLETKALMLKHATGAGAGAGAGASSGTVGAPASSSKTHTAQPNPFVRKRGVSHLDALRSSVSTAPSISQQPVDFKNIFGSTAITLADTHRMQQQTLLSSLNRQSSQHSLKKSNSFIRSPRLGSLPTLSHTDSAINSPIGGNGNWGKWEGDDGGVGDLGGTTAAATAAAAAAHAYHDHAHHDTRDGASLAGGSIAEFSQFSLDESEKTERHVVKNKAAQFKASLHAKSMLMSKVVQHKAELYHSIEKARKKILYQVD